MGVLEYTINTPESTIQQFELECPFPQHCKKRRIVLTMQAVVTSVTSHSSLWQ